MSTVHHTPTHSHSMRFPSVGMEVLSAVIHLFGVSTLSFLLAKKISWADISSPHALARISWPRLLILLTVIDSWLFLFSTGLLVNGTGMELSATVCLLGVLNCICFYATSKILIYLFLVEKVYVVWSGAARKKRLRSPVYLACLGIVSLYLGVAVFLILARVSYFRDDGSCVIGLTRPASLTLLIYDLLVNVSLTSLFVWPLINRKLTSPRIRKVAIRTLWAAAVALTTSCVNILVLTIMHGKQLAWVCLASCGTDVIINAAVLCWVTSNNGSNRESGSAHESSRECSSAHEGNIVDCTRASDDTGHSDTAGFMRRRARSEPPRPAFSTRIGRFSRLFDRRVFAPRMSAETDLERAAAVVVLEDKDLDTAKGDSGVVEGMYEHAPGSALSQPVRAYASMLKRSNQSLKQHLNDSQVQIQVTEETEVLLDEVPPPPTPKSKKRHRKNHSKVILRDEEEDGAPQ